MTLPKLPEPDFNTATHYGPRIIGYSEKSVRAIQEEAYLAGMAAERERCLALCNQVDEDGEGPDCWGWHAKDYAKAIQEVK
jgi:hypothetical protein